MILGIAMITIDTVDPDRLAAWWADATGGQAHAVMPGEFVQVVLPDGPRLGFQRVDLPTAGKNRVHVDLSGGADLDAEVQRLVSLGATETARHQVAEDFRWAVLTDPDGNVFCVATGH